MEIIRQMRLPNGLAISFADKSRRYFGDYHHVQVEAVCEVPVPEGHEAANVVGRIATYRRVMSMMGIPSARVGSSLDELLDNFEKNVLPYLSSPSFPDRFIRSEAVKRQKQHSGFLRTPRF